MDMIRKLLTVCVLVLANENILSKGFVSSIGHLNERPCSDADLEVDPTLVWCPDSFKDAKEGESMVQAGANIVFILINIGLMIFIRPYRCLECKMEQLRIGEPFFGKKISFEKIH